MIHVKKSVISIKYNLKLDFYLKIKYIFSYIINIVFIVFIVSEIKIELIELT